MVVDSGIASGRAGGAACPTTKGFGPKKVRKFKIQWSRFFGYFKTISKIA